MGPIRTSRSVFAKDNAKCPACGQTGTLEGDDGSDMSYDYDHDDETWEVIAVWALVTVPAENFSCPTCHLVLDRYELIEQAGLPDTFQTIDDDPDCPSRNTATTEILCSGWLSQHDPAAALPGTAGSWSGPSGGG